MNLRNPIWRISAACAVCLLLVLFGLSALKFEHGIDLATGRELYTTKVGPYTLRHRWEETAVSRNCPVIVRTPQVAAVSERNLLTANYFFTSVGVRASSNAWWLSFCEMDGSLDPIAVSKLACSMIESWKPTMLQNTDYIDHCKDIVATNLRNNRTTTADEIPSYEEWLAALQPK